MSQFPLVPEFGPTFDSVGGFTFSADLEVNSPREAYAVLPDGESWYRLNCPPGISGRIRVFPHYGDVLLGLNPADGSALAYTDLSFGCSIAVNGGAPLNFQHPAANQKYVSSDQRYIRVERLKWAPEDEIEVTVWADDVNRFEAACTFQAPRFVQPFPSWTWINPRWEPPVPYPNDGNDYRWDEAGQQWVLVP